MAKVTEGWRELPTSERIQFKNPPLVLTVFQIRFNTILDINNSGEIGKFQRLILEDYPITGSIDDVQFEVEISPSGGTLNTSGAHKGWQFSDAMDEWKLTLTVDALTIETRRYDNFEEFIIRIDRAVAALLTVYKPSILYRIGLRYINEIRDENVSPDSWQKAINPALLGQIADESFSSSLSQTSSQFVDMDEYGRGLNMRYGRLLNGSTVQPSAGTPLPSNPFFYIDIDFYREFDRRRGTKLESKGVDEIVDEFHYLVWQVFNWSVTAEYLDTLERA